jgi:hypothetical protein
MGLLLGLDLSGTAEVADCFALPTGLGAHGVGALLDGDKSESESPWLVPLRRGAYSG